MANNPLLSIKEYVQIIHPDTLTRDLIQSGELKHLIEEWGIRGITTNPFLAHDTEATIKAARRYY